MALFSAADRRDSLRFHFLSHVQVFSWEISLVCRLKYPYSCFSSYFCLLFIAVLWILMFSVLFIVTVICLFLFFCVCHISDVKPYAIIINFLSFGPFLWVLPSSISRIVPSILQAGQPKCLSPWWGSYCRAWFRRSFFVRLMYSSCYFFFYLRLIDGIHFQYSQVLIGFLFSVRSSSFFIWPLHSFSYLFYFRFLSLAWHIFYVKLHSHILPVYSHCF